MNPVRLLSPLALVVLTFARPALAAVAPPTAPLPAVPAGLKVELFASEPLLRNPCAMVFDARGRLFVGQGPQYRNPKPETPPDSVLILIDRNGDGVADATKVFATGFNTIQGMVWHGRDLWVGNAPDLTIVRDLDGDDEADEYVLVYSDLGNVEHGIHGLNWGPDGKLYFTKGNSKGLTQPGRIAPKPFRELWDVTAPAGAPDFPPPRTFRKGEYKSTYQDPRDNWGREGGLLRCDDLGANLEIVARGTRNMFDAEFDHGFDWLGTDNDQSDGDRIVMPFQNAHFGWAHAWSSNWTGYRHIATAPVSGPVFTGSGTGIVYYDYPQLPPEYRGVWFINDFLRKTTFTYRPRWEGALMQPDGGGWQAFAEGPDALFKPVDLAIGPDGALYSTGWGNELGVVWKGDQQVNEGRLFRISWPQAPRPAWQSAPRAKPPAQWTFAELVAEFSTPISIWRTNAQEELLRRGAAIKDDLVTLLGRADLPTAAQTWALWTLGRLAPQDEGIDRWLATFAEKASRNGRTQALRILAHRVREFRPDARVPAGVTAALRDAEPRVRFAAVQAIGQARQTALLPALWDRLAEETDRLTFYAGWQAARRLANPDELRARLADQRPGVRRAALLALLEGGALKRDEVAPLVRDADPQTSEIAALWVAKQNGNPLIVMNPWPGEFTDQVRVNFTPGIKPGTVAFTTDGSEPSLTNRASGIQTLKETTTMKVALFVEGRQVGSTVNATWRKRPSRPPVAAATLTPRAEATSLEQVLPLIAGAKPQNGHALMTAAGCFTCHLVGDEGRSVGPELSTIGDRGDVRHILRSMLEPNAVITEGYALVTIAAQDGKSAAGIFQSETDTLVTLVQLDGEPVKIEKAKITKRESAHLSVMPAFDRVFAPQQMADVAAWLMAQRTPVSPAGRVSSAAPAPPRSALTFALKDDRVVITDQGKPVADYVFKDPATLRPHFANVHAPGGVPLTRPHPAAAPEAIDHKELHPGIWMAFAEVGGFNYWSNKETIEHLRFSEPPVVRDGRLQFATENRFASPAGETVATHTLRFSLWREGDAYWLLWDSTIRATPDREVLMGEKEEMGLGIRLRGALIEKGGSGLVTNSSGDRGAKTAWGKVADWSSYTGTLDGRRLGAAIFAHPDNPRRSWWHTRDYGLIVANAFGKRVLPAEADGKTVLKPNGELRLRYGILLFNQPENTEPDLAAAAAAYLRSERVAR